MEPVAPGVQAPAETIDRHVTGPVDAVVCNSAIWQADLTTTAAAVRNLLAAGGRFVFNMGAGYLGQQQDPNCGDGRPSPVSIMRDIAAQDYGWRPPARPPRLAGGPGRPGNPPAAAWTAPASTSSRSPSSPTTATPAPSGPGCRFPSSPSTTFPGCPTRTGCESSPDVRPPRHRPAGASTLGRLRRPRVTGRNDPNRPFNRTALVSASASPRPSHHIGIIVHYFEFLIGTAVHGGKMS
jgi:hypothetical protein